MYADDVNLYVSQSSDINIINIILSTYQSVYNAKVNCTNSCGVKMNGWDVDSAVNQVYHGMQKNEKCRYTFWGEDDAIAKKWH